MATICVILWPRPNKDKKHPLKIRITKDKKPKYLPTGIAIKKSDWNKSSGKIRTTHRDCARFNDKIKEKLAEVETIEKNLRSHNPSSEMIWKVAKGEIKLSDHQFKVMDKTEVDFFSFTDRAILRLQQGNRIRTARNTRVMLNKLKDFWPFEKLPFDRFSVSLLKDFEAHLRGKGNGQSTIAKEMSRIRKMINDAVDEGLMEITDSPFLRYSIKQGKPPQKTKLTAEELGKLFNHPTNPGTRLWDTQNIFRFQFYLGGIRIGDCLNLKWENIVNGRIEYAMAKTNEAVAPKLIPPALEILELYRNPESQPEDYIFSFLNNGQDYSDQVYFMRQIEAKTALINKNLKILAKKCEIEKNVTTHIARHSMADYLRKSGKSIYDIAKVLGHSSIKITERYLASLDQEAQDGAMDVLAGI